MRASLLLACAAGVAAAIVATATTADAACPDIHPAPGLDLKEWARASWYIQQQQINGYQKANDLFCVVATYDAVTNKTVPFFKGQVVFVHNYQNLDRVNGKAQSTDVNIPSGLCARQPNASLPADLLVAPCFLPNFAAGPYWVIAYGTDAHGKYEWGVVSGGAPTVQYSDGCTTKETGVNDSGLWIFARQPVASKATIDAARAALTKLGYTLQRLQPVAQQGCNYTGAVIKPN